MSAVNITAQTRLLVIAPHPDDETLAAGILIQQVLAAGGAIKLLLLTDGDNNPWPQRYLERRLRIDTAARQRWGRRRREESHRAIARLGVAGSSLETFGWPDMGITDRLIQDTQPSIAAITAVLDAFSPDVVVLPALEDRHPDHGAAHVLCRLALAAWHRAATMLAFPVHVGAANSDYPMTASGSEAQRRCKLAALAEYGSQMALSGGRMRRMALNTERYQVIENLPMARRLPWQPSMWIRPWLRLLIATPMGVSDVQWRDAPLTRSPDGHYQLTESMDGDAGRLCFVKAHLDLPSPWIFDHWGWQSI